MSVYLLCFFGAASGGSALWGYLAKHVGIRETLLVSAAVLLAGSVTAWLAPLVTGEELNLHPSGHWPEPPEASPIPRGHGPILVTVEYEIPLDVTADFRKAMEEIRALRFQNGVLRWGLFVDIADPGKYREVYLEESWGAHLRQHERVSSYEQEVATRAYCFHRGKEMPLVFHHAYCDAFFPDARFDAARDPFADRPVTAEGVPVWFMDDSSLDGVHEQDMYTIDHPHDGSYTPQA